jgi:hypothetical protein
MELIAPIGPQDRLDPERVYQVLGPLRDAGRAKDGRPDLQTLAAIVKIRVGDLGQFALKRCSQERLELILHEAATLQGLNLTSIFRFATRKMKDPPAELIALSAAKACTDCGEFKPDIDPRVCKCRDCRRKDTSRAWIAAVEAQIGAAPEHFRRAWEMNRANPSYAAMATTLNWNAQTFSKRWLAAGLPERPVGRPRRTSSPRSRSSGSR